MMSFKKSTILLTFCFSAMLGLGLYFFFTSLVLVSGFTSFVSAEHRWSDTEKNTVYNLTQYTLSGQQKDFSNFLRAQKMAMGYRAARLEFQKESPDFTVVQKSFAVSPADVAILSETYKLLDHYGRQGALKKALEKWNEGDNKIIFLDDVASELHQEFEKNEMTTEKKDYYLARIARSHEDFLGLEKEFSNAISEANNNYVSGLWWISFLIFAGLVFAAAAAAYFLTKSSLKNVKSLSDNISALVRGSYDVSFKDSKDETEDLVRAFKTLSEDLRITGRDIERAQELTGMGNWKWDASRKTMQWSKKLYEILNIAVHEQASYESFRSKVHPEDRAIFDNLLKEDSYKEIKILPVELRLVSFSSTGWNVKYYKFLVEPLQKDGTTIIAGTVLEDKTGKSVVETAS